MSRIGYIDVDIYGRKYIREILPIGARPVEEWYNKEFAAHCMEIPDSAEQSNIYDSLANSFYPWCAIEDDIYFKPRNIAELAKEEIDTV